MSKFCSNCGAQLNENDNSNFCSNCGAGLTHKSTTGAENTNQEQTNKPAQRTLVGWSDACNKPEIIRIAGKHKKHAVIFAVILSALFIIGFTIAGFASDELEPGTAILIGCGLALMMIVISLVRVNNMKKPIWDGRVVNKTEKRKTKTENYGDDEHLVHYMEYTVYLQGADGSKKKIRIQNNREWYDYLNIGDYVRYHPSFSTYEKYDKSHDSYIFCNICGKKNDIRENYCCFCKSLLFK